jgi:hypothetical protein
MRQIVVSMALVEPPSTSLQPLKDVMALFCIRNIFCSMNGVDGAFISRKLFVYKLTKKTNNLIMNLPYIL